MSDKSLVQILNETSSPEVKLNCYGGDCPRVAPFNNSPMFKYLQQKRPIIAREALSCGALDPFLYPPDSKKIQDEIELIKHLDDTYSMIYMQVSKLLLNESRMLFDQFGVCENTDEDRITYLAKAYKIAELSVKLDPQSDAAFIFLFKLNNEFYSLSRTSANADDCRFFSNSIEKMIAEAPASVSADQQFSLLREKYQGMKMDLEEPIQYFEQAQSPNPLSKTA